MGVTLGAGFPVRKWRKITTINIPTLIQLSKLVKEETRVIILPKISSGCH